MDTFNPQIEYHSKALRDRAERLRKEADMLELKADEIDRKASQQDFLDTGWNESTEV